MAGRVGLQHPSVSDVLLYLEGGNNRGRYISHDVFSSVAIVSPMWSSG